MPEVSICFVNKIDKYLDTYNSMSNLDKPIVLVCGYLGCSSDGNLVKCCMTTDKDGFVIFASGRSLRDSFNRNL